MLTNGLSRRGLMVGAGALAARGAMPMVATASGILIPQIAHAQTVRLSGANANVSSQVIDGKTVTLGAWPQSNGDVFSFLRDPSVSSSPVFACRNHVVNGQRVVSKYRGCTIKYVSGTSYDVTFPSTHVHRVLRSRYNSDTNGNGSVDFRPSIIWESGVTNLTSFDSNSAWGINYLIYRTYRRSNGTEFIKGAVKSDLDDGATPEWIGFTASGTTRTNIMTRINELKREYGVMKSAQNTAIATTSVGAVLVGAGTRFAFLAFASGPAVGVAACTLGVLWVANAGFQWSNARKGVADFRFDQREFESYVRGLTTGKTIYNP